MCLFFILGLIVGQEWTLEQPGSVVCIFALIFISAGRQADVYFPYSRDIRNIDQLLIECSIPVVYPLVVRLHRFNFSGSQ